MRDVVDTSGTVLDHVEYTSFGAVSSQTGATYGGSVYFTGEFEDLTAQIEWAKDRQLLTTAMVWMQRDPILFAGGQSNLSEYVGNDPTNATDPSGCQAADDHEAIAKLDGGTELLTKEVTNKALDINGTITVRKNPTPLNAAGNKLQTADGGGPTANRPSFAIEYKGDNADKVYEVQFYSATVGYARIDAQGNSTMKLLKTDIPIGKGQVTVTTSTKKEKRGPLGDFDWYPDPTDKKTPAAGIGNDPAVVRIPKQSVEFFDQPGDLLQHAIDDIGKNDFIYTYINLESYLVVDGTPFFHVRTTISHIWSNQRRYDGISVGEAGPGKDEDYNNQLQILNKLFPKQNVLK